jgi:PKD repeat protein
MKPFLFLCFSLLGTLVYSQSHNLGVNVTVNFNQCSGTLYDDGGPNGDYFAQNYQSIATISSPHDDSLFINVKQFKVGGFASLLIQGVVNQTPGGPILGTINNNNLSLVGNEIYIPTGRVRIIFNASTVPDSGMAIDWYTRPNQIPTAIFSINDPNQAFNTPIKFVSNSLNSVGSNKWVFGDGNSVSNLDSVVYRYQTAGVFHPYLIEQSCFGADTSFLDTVIIQAAPQFTLTSDTIFGTIGCDGIFRDTIHFNYIGGGDLILRPNSQPLTKQLAVVEDFSDGLDNTEINGYTSNPSPYTVSILSDSTQTDYVDLMGANNSGNIDVKLAISRPDSITFRLYADIGNGGTIALWQQENLMPDGSSFIRYLGGFAQRNRNLFNGSFHHMGSTGWKNIALSINWETKSMKVYTNGLLRFSAGLGANADSIYKLSFTLGATGPTHLQFDDIKYFKYNVGGVQVFNDSTYTNPSGAVAFPIAFDMSGLKADTYHKSLELRTNSALADSLVTFPIIINVDGKPVFSPSKNCFQLDTLFQGSVAKDSLQIHNTGCDTLFIDSIGISAGNQVNLSSSAIAPNDSAQITLSFTAQNLGYITNLVQLFGNLDTTICISGFSIPPPALGTNKDTANFIVNHCGSVKTDSFYFKNIGQNTLEFTQRLDTSFSKLKVLLLTRPNYSRVLVDSVRKVLINKPFVDFHETQTQNDTAIANVLSDKNVLVVPGFQMTSGSGFSPQGYANWVGAIRSFVNNGGKLIFMHRAQSLCDSLEGFEYNYRMEADVQDTVSPSNHSIASNVQWGSRNIHADILRLTNPNRVENVIGDRAHIYVGKRRIGAGEAIYFGGKLETSSNLQSNHQILKNLIEYCYTQDPRLYLDPVSGSIPGGDSLLVKVQLNTSGYKNGNYHQNINLITNDPLNLQYQLPVQIQIQSGSKLSLLDSACSVFDSLQQGKENAIAISIENIGCTPVTVDSLLPKPGYTALNLPLTLAPNEIGQVKLNYETDSTGSITDSLVLVSADTSLSFCVTNNVLKAPIISAIVDTLFVDINRCKLSTTAPITLFNSGDTTLRGNLKIGDYRFSQTKTYDNILATNTFVFKNIPDQADSLIFEISYNGDFNWFDERLDFKPGLFPQAQANTQYLFYQPNVHREVYTGFNTHHIVNGRDSIFISLFNDLDVDGNLGSFHKVDVRYVAPVAWANVFSGQNMNIPKNDSSTATLAFSSGTLPSGEFKTVLSITSNAANEPFKIIPIVFNVFEKPEMALSDTCLAFPATIAHDTTFQALTIYNNGCSPLIIDSLNFADTYFSMAFQGDTIATGDSLTVNIAFSPDSASFYFSDLVIYTSNDNDTICLNGLGYNEPVADFTISDENICAGEVKVETNASFFNSVVYNMGDGTTYTQSTFLHTYAQPGTYRVSLRASNNQGFDTISKLTTVLPFNASFSMSADTVAIGDVVSFTDSSSGAVSWQWDFGDGGNSTSQNPQYIYSSIGTYNISLTAQDARNCNSVFNKNIVVIDNIGLSEHLHNANVNIYPNPFTEEVNIEFQSNLIEDCSIKIYNPSGQALFNHDFEVNKSKIEVDLKFLSAGTYILRLESNTGITLVKLTKM